jgi:serine/threonine-protein kinase
MLSKLGRYEIIEELGRGAMGVIYKAKDPVIGRFVAVKTVRLGDFTAPGEIEELRSRLMREAQSAGVLSHPNIITIFDVGEEGGLSYFAMELVEGATLEHLIETGQRLDEVTIVHVARQTADALAFAHQRGIVHRDIKPANIMLTQEGRVKVADFGIAKVGSAKMTQTGMLLGSPSYMAPEHFLGHALDGRSDIFALGIVMYELITGHPPFAAQNLGTLSYKIVHEDAVPPNKLKPGLNPQLNALVVKALARDPAQRFQTAEELRSALDALRPGTAAPKSIKDADPLLKTVAIPLPPEPERSRAGRWLLMFSLLIIGAAAGIAIIYPERARHALHTTHARLEEWLSRTEKAASTPPPPEQPVITPAPKDEKQEQPTNPAPFSPAPAPDAGPGDKPSTETTQPERPPEATSTDSSESVASVPPASTPSKPESQFGTLQVSSTPPGAEIILDDNSDPGWKTPYSFQNVRKGRHTLEVRKSGYVIERRIVILLGKESERINVVLALAAGILKVSTVPAGASIYVDGQLKREVTPANLKIPAGARRILLRKEGYRDVERVLEIEDNSVTTLNQPLAQAPD